MNFIKKFFIISIITIYIAISLAIEITIAKEKTDKVKKIEICGVVNFPKTGNIVLRLYTKEEMDNENSEDKSKWRRITIKPSAEELADKKVKFCFKNVPTGKYGIQSFQDLNGNDELDMGLLGPKEPWGTHRHKHPVFRGPSFEEMSFEAFAGLKGIVINMK